MLNERQAEALSDALSRSGPRQGGLVRLSGTKWAIEDGSAHSNNTIRALLNRGYLQLYVSGAVAHITATGVEALDDWREETTLQSQHSSTIAEAPGNTCVR